MRVAIVQYEPQLGQVERNMRYVDQMLVNSASLSAGSIDILMLSEMNFTGYVFPSKEAVAKVAEIADQGPTFAWCRAKAQEFKCLVTCGYVEKVVEQDQHTTRLYNSMMVVSPEGKLVCNPRKTFLYDLDKPWATPGEGFISWHCPWLNKTICFGICMDINPKDFVAPFAAFEYANFVLDHPSDLIIYACAWCDHEPPETTATYPTLAYWATRLGPVIDALENQTYDKGQKQECLFLCSNRIGTENGTTFVGASCVLSLASKQIIRNASRHEETVLVVDIC